jgi:hypothetical protein
MASRNQYVGRAGQLAVMGELAWRGYNIAIPEIDIGDDVFAVNDATGHMWRLQVKTATEKPQKNSNKYQFKVKATAMTLRQTPDLHFVFAMRGENGWQFLIMDRMILSNYVKTQNVGTPADKERFRRFDIILRPDGSAKCAGVEWRHHLGDWSTWPPLS